MESEVRSDKGQPTVKDQEAPDRRRTCHSPPTFITACVHIHGLGLTKWQHGLRQRGQALDVGVTPRPLMEGSCPPAVARSLLVGDHRNRIRWDAPQGQVAGRTEAPSPPRITGTGGIPPLLPPTSAPSCFELPRGLAGTAPGHFVMRRCLSGPNHLLQLTAWKGAEQACCPQVFLHIFTGSYLIALQQAQRPCGRRTAFSALTFALGQESSPNQHRGNLEGKEDHPAYLVGPLVRPAHPDPDTQGTLKAGGSPVG